jgi:CRISPR-associated protein Cpf1
MKYFALEKDKKLLRDGSLFEIDNAFYNKFDEYYNDCEIIKYYNEFRNFLTKKQFSKDKIKLNFEN